MMLNNGLGGIYYRFFVSKPEELLGRVRRILSSDSYNERTKMSLLPMEMFSFSITVPGKGNNISYETLARFRSVELPAERDSFASNSDKLGSKALSDLLQKGLTPDSQVKNEEKYTEFFDTIREEGKLDTVLNWQDYSEIPNAQEFFQEISILPNMPQMSISQRNPSMMTKKPSKTTLLRMKKRHSRESRLCRSSKTLARTSLGRLFCFLNISVEIYPSAGIPPPA